MAAVASRWAADGAIGLLLRSFNLIRTLSTSPAQSPTSASSAAATKPKRRKKKKNLFEVVQFLPNWGIGNKMSKSYWRDVSYDITKINLYKGGQQGKA